MTLDIAVDSSLNDLTSLSFVELAHTAMSIRELLIEKVCATGGHLGCNLGVVELTLALHRVFRSPHDVLLFDTGHQTYVHKILTGRAGQLDALRQKDGLSGYPCRAESAHDWIESSHAGSVLSYADGLAKAFQLRGHTDRAVVAVIGDGAMTSGVAWEGLNNLTAVTAAGRPVIIILNDNGRSYDPTIGGWADHLARLRRSEPDSTVFESLGLTYIGPVDGHDVVALESAFVQARSAGKPVVVHCVTVKGKGYPPAEADPADRMHAVGAINPATSQPLRAPKQSWTQVFGTEITKIGAERPEVVAITAAMLRPVGLAEFADSFADRVFDVGIAEQHAVCSAAGLAMGGLHPVVCVYATFLNRALDQVLMDVALHNLPVTFVLDRAGITGPDGASHHGMWDLSMLAAVPGLRIAAPRDPARLGELLREAVDHQGPTAVRFPKANAGPDIDAITRMDGVDILHRTGGLPLDVLLIAAGTMAQPCLDAAAILADQGIGVTVIDPRWIIPVHPTVVHLAARHRLAVTVEDNSRTGGMGSLTQLACADAGITTPIRVIGLPRAFLDHAERSEILQSAGLVGRNIADTAIHALSPTSSTLLGVWP